ncbi:phosphoenolpyruvate--protein phosphotransferase [Cerasicoccus fimbriatus]|uniref:phosphoenolpyruvate--protein phosphotransferase n=1 Tax=Cerasicoccus fimbriatus TaxID=3014554 RepID=UPI0022B49179|nr:phosphoenolpyruvate--protein phosphotransferase [Cerasicoccus sp. TK19100]
MDSDKPKEIILDGIAASPGVAHGLAFVILQKELEIPVYEIPTKQLEHEKERFEKALLEARRQIAEIRHEIAGRLGENEARIFDAHIMVLEDRALIEETLREMEDTGYNVEYCFREVSNRFIEAFEALQDDYLKERVKDIEDVSRRVLQILLGQTQRNLMELVNERIIVSEDITPSEAASFDKKRILGVVTDSGSRTSHAVIMARSLGVPAVVGLHNASEQLDNEDYILIDGYDGIVIINPSEETLFRYGELKSERQNIQRVFESSALLPATTADGHRLEIGANIGGPEDCESALERGAEGVGLYRTEALFMQQDAFPDEEDQYQAYREVAEALSPHPVILRTLDLGGDKHLSDYFVQNENNPFMGFRAIRFCLEHRDLFKDQLRAILRASAVGNVKIMYPMISSAEELIAANLLLEEAKKECRERGQKFDKDIQVGAMIEIPGAAYTCDLLAEHCDFFSIGTNDLIQYLLAVDRVNDRIAHLYEPNHPAVIRTLKVIIETANKHNVHVGVCGEMAGDPIYVPLLFGLGADEISATGTVLPEIKYLIRKMKLSEAKDLAKRILRESDPHAIRNQLTKFYETQMRDVLEQID